MSIKEFKIVVSIRQLLITVIIVAIMIMGLIGFYLYRNITAAKKRRLRHYLKSSQILRKDLLDDPTIKENKYKIERYRKGDRILRNKYFDDDVIVFSFKVADHNDVGKFVIIKYVDELMKVSQVNYTPSDDEPNELGCVFITTETMPPPSMRMFGVTELCILLMYNETLSYNDLPYIKLDSDKPFLVVPKSIFNGITTLEGQFILLGKENKVLDRFDLKGLGS